MPSGEAFDQVRSLSLCPCRVHACKTNFSEHMVEERKELSKPERREERGKKVIITLFYEGGRF